MQQVSSFISSSSCRTYDKKRQNKPSSQIDSCAGKEVLHFMGSILLVCFLLIPCTSLAMEYGETGPYRVSRESFANPVYRSLDVTVFLPQNVQGRVPVVFFAHGYGGSYYQAYKGLCEHVASQGVAVVFSPYPSSKGWSDQYDIMWEGFEKAATSYRWDFDLDYVGFVGHSWGGGAIPNMTLRGKKKGWGQSGMLMFIMAPGPNNGVTEREMESLDDANLIVQTFEYDDMVPESMATDIYDTIGVPNRNKAYYFIQRGEHSEPSHRTLDDYDRLAIWKPLDALMDYTFDMDNPSTGRAYALDGQGEHWRTIILLDEGEELTDDGDSNWSSLWFTWLRR